MPLDRAHLTRHELDELTRALRNRRRTLSGIAAAPWSDRVVSDAKWRLYVVESLLDQIDAR